MTKNLGLAISLLIGTLPCSAQAPCLKYESEIVELIGQIKRQTFPGPPNYESVKHGDRPETYWVLYLVNQICVESAINSPEQGSPSEHNISRLQLTQVDYDRFRKLIGKKVRVKGRLLHAVSGHHHTPVMLETLSIEPAT